MKIRITHPPFYTEYKLTVSREELQDIGKAIECSGDTMFDDDEEKRLSSMLDVIDRALLVDR